MGRWQPDARGRLGQAAMELYGERGYEQTTVAEIADRAGGLTARTFFRYFADKREVLFDGSDALGAQLVAALNNAIDAGNGADNGAGVGAGINPGVDAGIDAAAVTGAPFANVIVALDRGAELIGDDREYSLRRQSVIVANVELKERELTKLASWSRALAETLGRRGVSEPAASLAAETGVAVFRVAFDRWLAEPAGPTLVATLHETVDQLRAALTPHP